MKIFKLIFKIVIVIVFVFSVLLNIILFGSSYNSLIFKYDEAVLGTLISSNYTELYGLSIPTSSDIKRDYGVQYETNSVENCTTFTAKYYWDKDANPTFATECETENEVSYTYFKNNVLYKYVDGVRTTEEITFYDAVATNNGLFDDCVLIFNSLDHIDNEENPKTSIHFSFSPFYFAGIRFTANDEVNSYRYDYDLKGRLRTIVIDDGDENRVEYHYSYEKDTVVTPFIIEDESE